MNNNKMTYRLPSRLLALLLLLITLGTVNVWGQSPDYSGVYYIGTVTHSTETPTSNFYMCPTVGYKFYDSDNKTYTDSDNGQPFITTYKCRGTAGYDYREAVWIIEKHPTQDYYYIKHSSDGKYLTYNPSFFSNVGRVRVPMTMTMMQPCLQ